jgi:hypothetical protein
VLPVDLIEFKSLYESFHTPISLMDCGKKCAPYNDYGIPFCCDTKHVVPAAYADEWNYLKKRTNLWHTWEAEGKDLRDHLVKQVPDGVFLLECLGHNNCIRSFRTITCRSFPFYPYITIDGDFLGMSYYWEYEDRCWVINNLDQVSKRYRSEFTSAHETLFKTYPFELDNYRYHSIIHRRVFGKRKEKIPLLHKNGGNYLISTQNNKLQPVDLASLKKFGPYEIAATMPFPDEKG